MTQKETIIKLFDNYTIETTPRAAKKSPFWERADPGTMIYVTFLPGSDFADTLKVTKRIIDEGFVPIPHLAARSMPSADFFADQVRALADLGWIMCCVSQGALPTP